VKTLRIEQSVDALANGEPALVTLALDLSTPPISRAKASRRARSSSSGFQFIRILRPDDFIAAGFVPEAGLSCWIAE